jgi:hypothetical protein
MRYFGHYYKPGVHFGYVAQHRGFKSPLQTAVVNGGNGGGKIHTAIVYNKYRIDLYVDLNNQYY